MIRPMIRPTSHPSSRPVSPIISRSTAPPIHVSGKVWLLLLALSFAMLGTVSAQGNEAEEAAAEATKLEISLGEMYFELEGQEPNAPIVLEAGETYALEFKNVGAVEHDVFIGRELVMRDGAPSGYATNLFSTVEVRLEGPGWEAETPGFIELELQPGEEIEVIVTLSEDLVGEWEIGCFMPGHYQAGMHAPFIIQ